MSEFENSVIADVEPDNENYPDNAAENTLDLAQGGEDEGDEGIAAEPPEGAEEEPKKRNKFQERIRELAQQRDQERQAREQLQNQIARQAAYQQQSQEGATWQSMEPDPTEFETAAQYKQAFGQWFNAGQQMQARAQQQAHHQAQAQQQAVAQQQAMTQKISSVVQSGLKKYPDFIEVISDPTAPQLGRASPAALTAVLESDAAAEITYFLGKNPEQIVALGQMSPVQAVKAIARIEQQFNPGGTPRPRQPHPPSRVGGSGSAAAGKEPKDINEWMEWRNKQVNR